MNYQTIKLFLGLLWVVSAGSIYLATKTCATWAIRTWNSGAPIMAVAVGTAPPILMAILLLKVRLPPLSPTAVGSPIYRVVREPVIKLAILMLAELTIAELLGPHYR